MKNKLKEQVIPTSVFYISMYVGLCFGLKYKRGKTWCMEKMNKIKSITTMVKKEQFLKPIFKSAPGKFRAEVSRCSTQQELKVNDTDPDTEKCATARHITNDKLTLQ